MAKTREIIISEVLEGRDQGNIQTISTVGDTDASSVTHLHDDDGFTRFITGMSGGVDYTSMSRTYRFQATTRSNTDVHPLTFQIRMRGPAGSQVDVGLWVFDDTTGATGANVSSARAPTFPDHGDPNENGWFTYSGGYYLEEAALRSALDEGRLGLEFVATPQPYFAGGDYINYLDLSYIGLLLSSDPVAVTFPPEVETSYGVKSLCWLKADSTTQPSPPVSGDVITTWRDENGATWNSEEPRGYGPVTWSTNQVNGKPAFHFGGGGTSSGLSRTDPTYQELPEVTVFAVLVSEVSGIFDIFTEGGYYESGPLDDYYSELFMGIGTRGGYQVARFYSYDYVVDNPDSDEDVVIDINANISNDTHVVTIQRGSAGTVFAQFDNDTYTGLPFETKDFYTNTRGSGYLYHREGAVPYNPLLAQSYYANHHVGLYCEALVVAGNGAGDWTVPMPASTRKRIQCALAAKWGITLDQCSVESSGASGWSVGRTIH